MPGGAPRPTVLFLGGGTAGHLAPGFALAEALEAAGVRCLFATPGEAVEAEWFAGQPGPRRVRAARRPRGVGAALAFLPTLGAGVGDALALLRRERVAGVVALGGWPSLPGLVAARLAGRPLAFVVADAVAGALVRRLGRLAGRIYCADPRAAAVLGGPPRVQATGPLLRPGVLAGRRDPRAFGLAEGRATLLVVGGSLGARGLNERVVAGLAAAHARDPALGARLQVLHAAGPDAARVAQRYAALGLCHRVVPFLKAMGSAYRVADLVVARAGAGTCAELAALGRPAVLVPYPHHADRQQFLNARPLVESGQARLVEEAQFTPECFAREVLAPLLDPASRAARDPGRRAARERALPAGAPDAAARAAADWIRFLGRAARRRTLPP